MGSAATLTLMTQLPEPVAETTPDVLAAQSVAVLEGSTANVTVPVLSVVTSIADVFDQGVDMGSATADVVEEAGVKLTVA